jgi:flavin reductase (DIM6/NTAB) family NADH-FMN oxidoreductase RutF
MERIFRSVDITTINENFIKIIGKDAMLITAGNINSFNTMTASWGGMGYIWKRPVAFIFIRPQRYTYQFAEKNSYFTISFFEPRFKKILDYCGAVTGKTVDKMIKTGLKPVETEFGNVYFRQSRLVMECKKIYYDDIIPEHFIDQNIQKNYPLNDYHRMYIGEIINSWVGE